MAAFGELVIVTSVYCCFMFSSRGVRVIAKQTITVHTACDEWLL
jgi:hypothetical protein